MTDLDAIRRDFLGLGRICAAEAPLYGVLAARVAEDGELMALAAGGHSGHPPANLLFGAVHFLLLVGTQHKLGGFYRTLGGDQDPINAFAAFKDFCNRHEAAIKHLVSTRRVQTNEVGRLGLLLPALALAQTRGQRPLHLIEIGASAGLNLCLDQFRYEYFGAREITIGSRSSAVMRIELRGSSMPEQVCMPQVAERIGVDLSPVDVVDDDAMRWLQALVWPDHVDRMNLLRSAIAMARKNPPRVVAGDGLDFVREHLPGVNINQLPCVFHSHAIYQATRQWRCDFHALLDELGARRDLAHISLEWLEDDPGPRLHLATWRDGEKTHQLLADTHHHGRWMRWLATIP